MHRNMTNRYCTSMMGKVAVLIALTFLVKINGQGGQGIQVQYDFTEEQPVHSVVGNLATDSGLDELYTSEQMNRFRYTAQQGRHMDKFRLHSSGLLTTARRIDRDSMCPSHPSCRVELNVVVQPNEFFQIIKVIIFIIDVNDNQPIFPQSSIEMPITESASINSRYIIPSPLDADSGEHTVQSFLLRQAGSKFDLVVSEKDDDDDSVDIHLVLSSELDRETDSEYDIQVVAIDGGTPELSGTIRIHIEVVDANDNNPKFENTSYIRTVPENLPVGSVVLQVFATDMDEGLNGDIMYSFTDLAREQFGDMFRIDIVTGEIILTHELDYETTENYMLDIMARDKGQNSLPDYTRVHINIQDINDHAPDIVVNSLTDSGEAEVLEGAAVGIFVAHILVVDLDSGVTGEVSCWLNDEHFVMQELYSKEYKVITKTVFDREQQDVYDANIVCEDGGSPALSSTYQLTVHVADANDHTPSFTHAPLVVEITENNVMNYFIARVNATDGDIGVNAQIVYAFTDKSVLYNSELLSVNPNTGVITATSVFDYEIDQNYIFAVTAADMGVPNSRTATTTLSIRVIDLNDELPTFSNDTYQMHVPENSPSNTVVGVVSATDNDVTPDFSEIVYTFDAENNGEGQFLVHPVSGTVFLKSPMDREIKSTYNLVIIASNPGHPSMRSETHVTVYITDTNDNRPTFLFPNSINSSISISDFLSVGDHIATIVTSDPDIGVNARVKYEIISNETIETFRINAETGIISVARRLNNLDYTSVELTVFAMDQGIPQNVVSEHLMIHIDNSLARAHWNDRNPWWKDIKLIIICALVPILLIIVCTLAMCVYHRRHNKRYNEHRYNCRIAEQEKMSCVNDGAKGNIPLPPHGDSKHPTHVPISGLGVGESSTDDLYSWPNSLHKHTHSSGILEQGHNRSNRSLSTMSPAMQQHQAKTVTFEPPLYDKVCPDTCDVEVDDNSLTDSGRGGSEEGEHARASPIDKSHYNDVSYLPEPYKQPTQQSHVVSLNRSDIHQHKARRDHHKYQTGHMYANNIPYDPERVPPHTHNVRRSNYNSAGESDSSLNSSPPQVYHQNTPSLQNGCTYRYLSDHNNQYGNDTNCYYPIKLYKTNSNAGDKTRSGEHATVKHSVNTVVGDFIVPVTEGMRTPKCPVYEHNRHHDKHLAGSQQDRHHLGVCDNISDGGTTTSGSYTVDDVDSVVSVDRSNDSVCV